MISKITGGDTKLLFKATILSKYEVSFYQCIDTGFIQTEAPYWLAESYSSAITKLDVGIVLRNENLTQVAIPLFLRYFNHDGRFLDFAGGYGLFTRMMRDRGFNFYHSDIYCQNIFAEYHDQATLPADTKFEVITAFEVLEHMADPLPEIEKIFDCGDNLFFSTELVPGNVTSPDDWYYFSLETGQHVAFYTASSLEYIAKKLGKHFYTDGKALHLFTKNVLKENPFEAMNKQVREKFFIRKLRKLLKRHDQKEAAKNPLPYKESLIDSDWREAKKKISS